MSPGVSVILEQQRLKDREELQRVGEPERKRSVALVLGCGF